MAGVVHQLETGRKRLEGRACRRGPDFPGGVDDPRRERMIGSMALETIDQVHATGTFIPVIAPPFTTQILNSSGIASFVRDLAGQYTVTLQNPMAFSTGHCAASLPANFPGVAGAQMAPDGVTVLVTVLGLDGVAIDPPSVGLTVRAINQSEGVGPAQDPLPAPPAPGDPGLGALRGWANTSAAGAFVNQSSPFPFSGLAHINASGLYDYTPVAPFPLAALVTIEGIVASMVAYDFADPLVQVRTFDAAGVLADRAHTIAIYSR